MSVNPLVKNVTDELLTLAQESARNWEEIRWLAWVGDCFDGGDYDGEFDTLRYRLGVVRDRFGDSQFAQKRTAYQLIEACQAVLDSDRAKEYLDDWHLGDLRAGLKKE